MHNLKVILKYGECKYLNIAKYPDGQQNVTLDLDYFNDCRMPIDIQCTVRNWSEMELLLCTLAALSQQDYIINEINFLYLFGMRSDRIFEPGMANYFRDVVLPIIRHIKITYNHPNITYICPHGRVFRYLHAFGITKISEKIIDLNFKSKIVIAGDESALPLTAKATDIYSVPSPYFIKTRFENDIDVCMLPEFYSRLEDAIELDLPFLIIDDLCDGGLTFIREAEYLREHFPKQKLELFVYHGLFTKGVDYVAQHFDKIYCTNSYQEIDHPKVKQFKVI